MAKAAVYTRTGDKGTTGLYTGERVPKQCPRVEAYGTIDELTSALGLARATVVRQDVKATILSVQNMLMSLMADVASINLPQPYITDYHVKQLEQTIDSFDGKLQPLTHFLLPGGHVDRGVCAFRGAGGEDGHEGVLRRKDFRLHADRGPPSAFREGV